MAFYRVWHKRLLFKLRSIGISENIIGWFKDYLSNRQQRVCIKGVASLWKFITAGVPQGSILGPTLFLIYINDIVKDIKILAIILVPLIMNLSRGHTGQIKRTVIMR